MSQKNLTTKQSRRQAYLICPHCGARKPMQPLDAMVMCLACHEVLLGKDMLPDADNKIDPADRKPIAKVKKILSVE